uniref:Regulatory protein LuxR family n=1 Tax=Streptomyces rimofaciens TaxID=504097 RepID=H9BDX4_9ACTN|nr:regulatory protein LuxR family [Streptomyces rimofaciens]
MCPLTEARLTGRARAVYLEILRAGGSLPRTALRTPGPPEHSGEGTDADGDHELTEAIDALVALRLIQHTDRGRLLAAISPQSAAAALSAVREGEIQRQRLEDERLRSAMASLQDAYDAVNEGRARKAPQIESLTDISTIRGLLSAAARDCRHEVLTAQPEALLESTLADSRPRDLSLLTRGIAIRTVYPHTVLSSPAVQQHFSLMHEAGTQIRTTTGVLDRVVIFDQSLAFLADRRSDGPGAVVIRHPAVVDYLYRTIEQVWRLAKPFVYTHVGYGPAADEIRAGILRLMAAGAKDEVIAKRMNMSTRTCRRHIAEMMAELGAESRFQAGVLAADRGLLRLSGGPPPLRGFRGLSG